MTTYRIHCCNVFYILTVDNVVYSYIDSVLEMFQNYSKNTYIVVRGGYYCVWTVLFDTVV